MSRDFLKDQIMINILQYIKDKDYEEQIDFTKLLRNLKDADLNKFFHSTEEIITEASKLAFKELVSYVTEELQEFINVDSKIEMFFSRFIDFYLKNKRLMNLIWFDKINLDDLTDNKIEGLKLLTFFKTLLEERYKKGFDFEDAQKILHRVHCYCLGEILIFISDRGMTNDSEAFKPYLISEVTNLTNIFCNLEIKKEEIN